MSFEQEFNFKAIENEDELDIFGSFDEEATAPQAEALAPHEDEPQIQIRTEKPKRHPGDPTKSEMDAHCLTHANYRSWCSICVRAALKEGPHYKHPPHTDHNTSLK